MIRALAAAAVAALLACAPAQASSIAYVKQGDVWLSSPDGALAYRLTSGGGWTSPSQADDGTIVALRGGAMVHLSRSGQALGPAIDLIGGERAGLHPGVGFYGPYDARVSPDGARVAYWFTTTDTTAHPGGTQSTAYHDITATTAIDRFDSTPQRSVVDDRQPSWFAADRLLVTDPLDGSVGAIATWDPAGEATRPFADAGRAIQYDATLSRDRRLMVTTVATGGLLSQATRIWFWSLPPEPTCQWAAASEIHNPSISPDASAVTYDDADGVHVLTVPDASCAQSADRLLAAGATEPEWGVADVDPAQAPRPAAVAAPPPPAAPAPPSALRAVRLNGRVLRFTLTAAGRVDLAFARSGRVVARSHLRGRAGANRVRVRRLRRGRYRLTLRAAGVRVTLAFRAG